MGSTSRTNSNNVKKYGVPDAYDTLKALTRGKSISKEDILKFAEVWISYQIKIVKL